MAGTPTEAPPSGGLLPPGWRAPLVVALLLRALMLVPSIGLEFRGDEPAYRALAASWAEFGAYAGQWPPLHPATIALCDRVFGSGGEAAARVLLTLLSVWSCAWTMALAKRAHSDAAGRIAGWIAALYLPLVPFAHVLLSEGLTIALLLPALTALLAVAQGELRDGRATLGIVAAGALVGLSCLARESGTFWVAALAVWCAFALRSERGPAVRRAMLFTGAALVTIAPWSAAATRSMGMLQVLGRTAGVNAYMGWNAKYVNFDAVALDVPVEAVPGARLRATLLEPPDGVEAWEYQFLPHLGERNREMVAAGSAFAREHPVFFARTRLVKAADLATPLSFMTRFLRMPAGEPNADGVATAGGYGPPLASGVPRIALSAIAILSVVLLAVAGVVGACLVRLRPGAASLVAAGFVATAPLALVVAMSRFRAPFEAMVVVAAAATVATLSGHGPGWRRTPLARAACAALLAFLAFAWYLSLPVVVAALRVLA